MELIQRIETRLKEKRVMILFWFFFLHDTQMNTGNPHITNYQVLKGSFIPYLKVFLHSSGFRCSVF